MDINLIDIKEEDLELIRNWRNSTEISQYMYTNDFISKEQQEKWFIKIQTDVSQKVWIIEYGGKKLGVAYLYNIKPAFKTTYWGFYLGDLSVRGAGIGSKVEFNMMQFVFETLGYNKLLCEVFVSNDSVIKMHEKFGFRREGYFREHILKDEKYLDVVSLALLKSEWVVLKGQHYHRLYNK